MPNAEFTWGKRNRLRERGLWLVDDDTYYTSQGPGVDPNEVQYRGYLHLVGTEVELLIFLPLCRSVCLRPPCTFVFSAQVGSLVELPPDEPLQRTESSSSIKIEGADAYSATMQRHVADVRNLSEGNPNRWPATRHRACKYSTTLLLAAHVL